MLREYSIFVALIIISISTIVQYFFIKDPHEDWRKKNIERIRTKQTEENINMDDLIVEEQLEDKTPP